MVPEVDLTAFAAGHADGAFVVDVREPLEYVTGHVPGAVLIPMAQVHTRMGEVPRGEPVYVICASGNRSYTAAGWLRNAGIDAISVAGGTGGWAAQRRPLVRGTEPDESAA
jgi:rhodanese-related sulfurtransferase